MSNSGNQSPVKSAEFRKALNEACSADDVQRVAKKLLEQAALGDTPSARLLLATLVPKQSFEDAVSERIREWKAKFLDELLYHKNSQSLRERLNGSRSSPDKQTSELLEMLGRLESFQNEA